MADEPASDGPGDAGRPSRLSLQAEAILQQAKLRGLRRVEHFTFAELVQDEERVLRTAESSPPTGTPHGGAADPPGGPEALGLELAGVDADEPWVSGRQSDRFGLALSGGGIRSATFNLGLLQSLSRPLDGSGESILSHVDYLSTVSGGGYAGGFWSRWLLRQGGDAGASFPRQGGGGAVGPEPEEVRHMRERSRFLMPRLGIFHADTWAGLVAVLGGALPSFAVACVVILLGWHLWLGCAYLLRTGPLVAAPLLFGGTFAVQWLAEATWRRNKFGAGVSGSYSCLAIVVSLCATLTWIAMLDPGAPPSTEGSWLFSLEKPWAFLFAPAIPWLATAGLLLLVRALLSRPASWTVIAALERATARCIAPALIWVLLAGLWSGALLVEQYALVATATSAGATIGAAGLFVWLRKWLTEPLRETRGGQLLDRLFTALRPVLPQVLAYIAVLGLMAILALALARLGRVPAVRVDWGLEVAAEVLTPFPFIGVTAAASLFIFLGAILLLNPERVGLHEFYRSRIEGTFLGAACDDTAAVNLADGDRAADVDIRRLRAQRPVHLVCCTGNNLGGDPLPNLYRGGRSVVISPFGVSLGSSAARYEGLYLSSALTASAAAFNSQMGGFSIRLGPAVGFLMTALGLRLGLWLPPLKGRRDRLRVPGWNLVREMFGMSHAARQRAAAEDGGRGAPDDVHLSDGGHFENLGLYELIRRRCRYVLVSDCGADADLAFDDLANAIRLVREDFGAEIEIDVTPLRPGDGALSAQHAVVGTIHYDGAQGSDKGILVYFKPTLVGDEPPDVTQYRTRNPAFPHEGTTDQFYDESQWESYRRLGLHCGGVVFGFVAENWSSHRSLIEWTFLEALERWQAVRAAEAEVMTTLARERDALLAEVGAEGPSTFRAQLFPEAREALGVRASRSGAGDEELRVLLLCARLTTLMERVWVAARLETHWTHPRNRPWMSFFERVAATPSFRRWWLLLRPSARTSFCDFMKLRLGLQVSSASRSSDGPDATVWLEPCEVEASSLEGNELYRRWRRKRGSDPAEVHFLAYRARWHDSDIRDVTVGLLAYRLEGEGEDRTACWLISDLVVPGALEGAGVISRFLDDAIVHLGSKARRLKVELGAPARDTAASVLADPAHRQERLMTTHFYKSRDFKQSSAHALVRDC